MNASRAGREIGVSFDFIKPSLTECHELTFDEDIKDLIENFGLGSNSKSINKNLYYYQ